MGGGAGAGACWVGGATTGAGAGAGAATVGCATGAGFAAALDAFGATAAGPATRGAVVDFCVAVPAFGLPSCGADEGCAGCAGWPGAGAGAVVVAAVASVGPACGWADSTATAMAARVC